MCIEYTGIKQYRYILPVNTCQHFTFGLFILDEWLGVDIDSIRRTVLNEKMITYFSKVFYSPTLNITGIHLGFNESDVNRCTCDSNGTSRESCRLLLKLWCNKMGDKATIGYLLESLYRLSQHEPSCIDKLSLDVALQKAKNSKY